MRKFFRRQAIRSFYVGIVCQCEPSEEFKKSSIGSRFRQARAEASISLRPMYEAATYSIGFQRIERELLKRLTIRIPIESLLISQIKKS